MIGQYLLNTNKSVTVSIFFKKNRTKQGELRHWPKGRAVKARTKGKNQQFVSMHQITVGSRNIFSSQNRSKSNVEVHNDFFWIRSNIY